MSIPSRAKADADVGLVYGAAGSGKTWALRRYADEHAETWYLAMSPAVTTPAATLARIARALDVGGAETTGARLERAIVEHLRGRHALVIVDEAHQLTAALLDVIRCVHDQARCGLVLAGNEPLWARLASGERAAQLVSRIGIRRRLTRPADTDILALAERLLRLRPTGDARRAVLQAGRGIGGLRAVRKLAGQALVSARAEGRDRIAPGDVALAAAMEAALATSCLSPQNQDRRTNDLPRGLLWHFRKCHSSPARPTGLAQATRLTFRRTYPQRSWWCLRRGNRRQGRRNPRGCRGWIE